ncbi:MAG: cysteine dioxygenase [Terriglobia bacterium]
MMNIEDFTKRLAEIPRSEFTHEAVLDFMRRNMVDVSTLSPYLYFSGEHYTRNLIQRTPLYELIAICWDIGQRSPIHNHQGQKCWMAMAYGKVEVHNFRLVKKDPANHFCELESSSHFLIEAGKPQEVDPAEPIHSVSNPTSFNSRAVTLHVYSLPIETCEIYDLKAKKYEDVILSNTTEFGAVKSTAPLEKVCL